MTEKLQTQIAQETQTCKHKVPIQNFCEECLNNSKQNQPSWKIIDAARETSRVKDRSNLDVECTVIAENDEAFTIGTIKSKENENLAEFLAFLDTHFGEDTLNAKETFIRKLEGKTKYEKPRPEYRCFYIKNNEGKIIGIRVSEQFNLEGTDGKPTNENIFYAMYIALDKEYRNTGIIRELYVSSLIDANLEAEKRNKKLNFMIAECSPRTEGLQNLFGLKRIYFKKDGVLTEFKYHQPPMKFNIETGEKDSGEPAEHLMVQKVSEGEFSKEELFLVIKSLYKQYQNGWPREAFETKEAFKKHEEYYEEVYENIKKQINESGELVLMSIDERKQAIVENKTVVNFEEADEGRPE